jgi:DNA polymerase-3 subunit delta
MSEDIPTIYLLYGDHELGFSEFIDQLRSKMGDPSTADINISHFTSDRLDLAALEHNCISMPFLSRRRLVIAEQATRLMSADAQGERLFQVLRNIPPTTALILIEPVDLKTSKGRLPSRLSELIKWLQNELPSSYIQRLEAPQGMSFISWIQKRTREYGGQIEPQAAHLLAELVLEDPRLAQQELLKLLDYVNRERPIQAEDVERLTPFHRQNDIFAMVDAIGQRDGSLALRLLRGLLEEESPLYIFSMVTRQFRLLLMAREAMDTHQDPKQALKLHPFVLSKLLAQARNFSLSDLERIYHLLFQNDRDSKIGQADLELALEKLVCQVGNP